MNAISAEIPLRSSGQESARAAVGRTDPAAGGRSFADLLSGHMEPARPAEPSAPPPEAEAAASRPVAAEESAAADEEPLEATPPEGEEEGGSEEAAKDGAMEWPVAGVILFRDGKELPQAEAGEEVEADAAPAAKSILDQLRLSRELDGQPQRPDPAEAAGRNAAELAAGREGGKEAGGDAERQNDANLLKGLQQALGDGLKAGDGEARPQGQSFQTMLGGLAAQGAAQPQGAQSAQAAQAAAQANIDTPVRQQGWGDSVGSRVTWMVNQKITNAQIQLNPKHLGPMEVRISMNNDQASVTFVSQHAPVREALEAAMPRLREMLAEQGVVLADGTVSDQAPQQERRLAEGSRDGWGGRHGGGHGDGGGDGLGEELPVTAGPARMGEGLLDMFA